MKKMLFAIPSLCLLLYSCQKELSDSAQKPDNVDTTHTTDTTGATVLLEKTITVSTIGNPDSVITLFAYNGNGKLVEENMVMQSKDQSGTNNIYHYDARYERDAQDRIVKIFRSGPIFNGTNGQDTISVNVYYENASSNKVTRMEDGKGIGRVEFEYQGNLVVKTSDYQHYPLPTDPMQRLAHHINSYDAAGNLVKREDFTDPDHDGSFEINMSYLFDYDTFKNPYYPADDALIDVKWGWWVSPDNITKQKNDYPDPRSLDDELVLSYEYDSNKLPEVSYFIGNGSNLKTHYYYR